LLVKGAERSAVDTLETTVRLKPGSFPGADSCLGPGQSYEEDGIDVSFDELPEVLRRVSAQAPPGHVKKGEARLVVRTLVCRTGRVLDGWAVWPLGVNPDAVLERAAVAAALQWTFQPGRRSGIPMATFVDIPFVFGGEDGE
jgi:hypothetical protein